MFAYEKHLKKLSEYGSPPNDLAILPNLLLVFILAVRPSHLSHCWHFKTDGIGLAVKRQCLSVLDKVEY